MSSKFFFDTTFQNFQMVFYMDMKLNFHSQSLC